MASILIKAAGIWLIIVLAAILNGTLREKVLVSMIGSGVALPLSGASLAVLVFLVSLTFVPFIAASETKAYVIIGLFWFILTLLFEFIFGHFVAGKSWQDIAQVFNVKKGDLFLLVLVTTAISPWLAAKIRGFI